MQQQNFHQRRPLPPPKCPSEIQRHYTALPIPNNYQCKQCGKIESLEKRTVDELLWHVRKEHGDYLANRVDPFTERMQNIKAPPKYLRKYEHMNIISDKWLDRLAIDGYPIGEIVRNVFLRLKSDPELFFSQAEHRTAKLIANKDSIISILSHLPLHLLPEQIADVLTHKFHISYEAAKLMIKKYSWSFLAEQKMFGALMDRSVFIKKYEQVDEITFALFATERMRRNYLYYGDVVNVEIKFTPLKRSRSGRHFNICLFVGQDSNLKPIVFAMALMSSQCPLYYKLAINYFLEAMDDVVPRTFITNEASAMGKVINDVQMRRKEKIGHMINWYYTMEKVKYELNCEYEGYKFLDGFNAALSSITENEYEGIIGEIKRSNKLRIERILSFEEMSNKTCIAKSYPCFIGFGIQADRVQMVNKAVQQNFPYQNRVGLFYNLAFRLDEQWNMRSCRRINLIDMEKAKQYKVNEIVYLSRVMQKDIFNKLLYLYEKSLNEVGVEKVLGCRVLVCEGSKDEPDQRFILNYEIENQTWRCSCRLIYWSGLPCQHLIKVIRRFRGSISYYINSRWMINSDLTLVPAFEEDTQEEEEMDILPAGGRNQIK